MPCNSVRYMGQDGCFLRVFFRFLLSRSSHLLQRRRIIKTPDFSTRSAYSPRHASFFFFFPCFFDDRLAGVLLRQVFCLVSRRGKRRARRGKESQGTKREKDVGRLSDDEGKTFKGFRGWRRVSLELREILTRKGAVQHSSRVLVAPKCRLE